MSRYRSASAAPKSIPSPGIVSLLLLNGSIGSTGALTNQGVAVVDLSDDAAAAYHEGLLRVEIITVNGQGGTPTTPGAGKTLTVYYAFTSSKITALTGTAGITLSDAPTILAAVASTVTVTLPDSNSTGAAGVVYTQSEPFIHGGRYLYVWYGADAFGSANSKIALVATLIRL